MMRESTDVAWCAGFFDGEGCVRYSRSRPSKHGKVSPQLAAQIAQKADNVEVLEFFQSTIGFGTMYGPYPYKTPAGESKEKFVLVYNSEEVIELFKIIKPYLKKRKTLDFQVHIMAYYMHDSDITEYDVNKNIRNTLKKMFRNNKEDENG